MTELRVSSRKKNILLPLLFLGLGLILIGASALLNLQDVSPGKEHSAVPVEVD
jgi:hypothetical protein